MSRVPDPTRRGAIGLGGAALVAAAAPRPALAGPWTEAGDIGTIGGHLHYRTVGPQAGEPLVLLHKLGGWIADWRHVVPSLAPQRRVIAFDLPGHGASVMRGPPPYAVSVPESAAMILAALDELGIDRFAVAGNSLGGIVGIVAAACWPARVSKLAIVSASLIGAMTRAAIADQDRAAGNVFSSYTSDGRPLPPSDAQNREFGTTDPGIVREQGESRAAAGLWVRASERGVARVGVTDYLPRIAVPTLLVNGERGRYARYADTGRRLIRDVRAVVIPGGGSFVHQEKPVEVAAALNAFLYA